MVYKFNEVLNDLTNYFLLGDILLLEHWKKANGLSNNLAAEFTANKSGDNVVAEGIMLPMTGVENYPYTIIFNLSDDTPELLQEGNSLQIRQRGYSLRVENNALMLFTWPVLTDFTDETIRMMMNHYKEKRRPMIEVDNGWYSVDVLGGETLQMQEARNVKTKEIVRHSGYEPTFEFVLKRIEAQKTMNVDINYSYKINSSVY